MSRDVDQAIRVAASRYLGWLYAQPGSGVPAEVAELDKHVPPRVVAHHIPAATVCSVFTAGVILEAFADAAWSTHAYADLTLQDGARPWSPIEAVVAAGIGREVQAPESGRWHLMQGWGSLAPLTRGHAWLWSPLGSILQASSSEGRVTWTERPWVEQCARYGAGVHIAVLG